MRASIGHCPTISSASTSIVRLCGESCLHLQRYRQWKHAQNVAVKRPPSHSDPPLLSFVLSPFIVSRKRYLRLVHHVLEYSRPLARPSCAVCRGSSSKRPHGSSVCASRHDALPMLGACLRSHRSPGAAGYCALHPYASSKLQEDASYTAPMPTYCRLSEEIASTFRCHRSNLIRLPRRRARHATMLKTFRQWLCSLVTMVGLTRATEITGPQTSTSKPGMERISACHKW